MDAVPLDEFDKVPYVQLKPTDGRVVFLRSFYDHNQEEWVLYVPFRPGELVRLAGGEPIVGTYFSDAVVDDSRDYEFPLGTFVTQHLSYPDVASSLGFIESDLHNFGAILEKYLLVANQPEADRQGATQLLAAEFEYLVILVRSLYDLLQKLSKRAAALIKSVEEPHGRIVEDLPDSFAKVVLDGSRLRSQEELQESYRLPPPIAAFYVAEALQFQRIRDLRVSIEHHGRSAGPFFDLKEGMAIAIQDQPWASLPIWRAALVRNERLGSLRAVFLFLVSECLEMLTRYAKAYASCIAVPPAIGPGYWLFLRDYFSHHLVSVKQELLNPWERASDKSAA